MSKDENMITSIKAPLSQNGRGAGGEGLPRPSVVYLLSILLYCLPFVAHAQLTQYVDPRIGTGGHGHTFPGATVPFGMVQLSPDTRVEGWDACSGYYHCDSTILGFSHTHLSGTGCPDYGDILVTPHPLEVMACIGGPMQITDSSQYKPLLPYASSWPKETPPIRFRHEDEEAIPGFYRTQLGFGAGAIKVELTATPRCGFHRYTTRGPKDELKIGLVEVNLHHGIGPDVVQDSKLRVVSDTEIAGYRQSTGWAKDQRLFFVARFSLPIKCAAYIQDTTLLKSIKERRGKDVRCLFEFLTGEDGIIKMKIGFSSVDEEGARKNLDAEIPGWDFDEVKAKAGAAWEKELGKIEVSGGTEAQKRTFYTALYHAMIAPNIYSDVDGRYRGMDNKIHRAKSFDMYTVFSLWDTFRAEHPLLSILDRKRTLDFVQSLLAKYDESGTLPVWELSSNETWCMIGYHSVPVIADAFAKGIRGFDALHALQAMKSSANADRSGLKEYRAHGFIPGDAESESVSKTLEYAYDDWCIAHCAKALGNNSDADLFNERAQSYKNLFDPGTRFMRPRVNGNWSSPFDPTAVTMHYTEANPWQYSFFAPQDIDGMISLYGGRAAFVAKLDSLFETSSSMTGRQQSDITGMIGQYAQGNEPSHHAAYLYNYAGAPWKTQAIVRTIMDSLYTDRTDGLCGNDDCGQMSAWYVMSALGLYQVAPGQAEYCIGSPLFPEVQIHLENGKTFRIVSNEHTKDMSIQSVTLDGVPYTKSFLTHESLMNGGELSLAFDSGRSEWGTRDEDCPHTLLSGALPPVPLIQAASASFADSLRITFVSKIVDAPMYYRIISPTTVTEFRKYSGPFFIRKSVMIEAYTQLESRKSRTTSASFTAAHPVGSITMLSKYSPQYTGGGDNALVDGLRGKTDFHLGFWQGYEGVDLNAVVDLGSVKNVSRVALSCLQDNNAWIFFPEKITIAFSEDGVHFSDETVVENPISAKEETPAIHDFEKRFSKRAARYIRVSAKNIGVCPPWHKGAGGKAWLFADEILIDAK